MRKIGVIVFVLLFATLRLYSQSNAEQEIIAANKVIERVIGEEAKNFEFIKTTHAEGLDSYEVHANAGKVQVIASSTIAMCHGAYDYLRKACHFQYTWSSNSIKIPTIFPDFDIAKITSPYKMRQYYNVCTYGYTMAFWGWDEWQRELDWMALHGINMPIAMIGQEAIWQKVWKSYGVTDKELDDYFTGPAFLPWHRMGNVNKHGGPAPKSYYTKSVTLQKQLLQRMRELGMMPIVPAFSGYVPDALKRVMPDAGIIDMAPWCGFTKDYSTHILMPSAKQFTEIGKKFIDEYTKEFGKCKYYLADAFNEMTVPIKKDKQTELAEFGRTIYNSIHQADTAGIWVMQGWLFFNDKGFWDKSAVQSFLKDVPDDKMIIIDLANESFHGWQEQDGFYGKNWICSYIHNYGGKTQLGGDLALFASDAPKMLSTPNHGKLCGFGISPEGINQNEVIYELLTDVAWTNKPIDLNNWLELWTSSRYGCCVSDVKTRWKHLLKSIYGPNGYHAPNLYQLRPSMNFDHKIYMSEELDSVYYALNTNLDSLLANQMLILDLIEFDFIHLGSKADFYLKKAVEFYKQNDTLKSKLMFKNAFKILSALDSFVDSIPERRLDTWVQQARKWGDTPEEKNYYEEQAKRQVTVWGGPVLLEYACKTWGGLINSYYLQRWLIFYNTLFNNGSDTIKQWEEKWITTPDSYKKPIREIVKLSGPLYYYGDNFLNINQYLDYITIHSEPQKDGPYLISIDSQDKSLEIYYTTDGSAPTPKSIKYTKPFTAKVPSIIKANTFKEGKEYGSDAELKLSLSLNKKVTLKEEPDGKYKGNGAQYLTDGISGSTDYTDGKWLGFEGKDMVATIDLGSVQTVKSVTINYLVNTNARIFEPSAIFVYTSDDNIIYHWGNAKVMDSDTWDNEIELNKIEIKLTSCKTRYINVDVNSPKVCPEGHPGAGQKCWIFIDEITVN